VQTDLPSKRLRELFNVNHFIVSQVNPHIVPLLRRQRDPKLPTMLRLLSSELEFRLGQIDHIAGNLPVWLRSIRGAATQSYTGDVTIVPDADAEAYAQLLANPTEAGLERALAVGQRAAWPRLRTIETQCKIGFALTRHVKKLRGLDRWMLFG
jgi:TAG lipase/steryl ester hydrolase/phospholipase A2/LPA acyltransferase